MPFTPAHPALILPLIRSKARFLSATGLVVGSIAPDVDYFLKMSDDGQHRHTIASLFYSDIPIALLLALLFHGIVKRNLLDNLPGFLQRRFAQLRQFDFWSAIKNRPLAVVISVAIGSASHLVWDGFTHPGSFVVEHLPVYDAVVPYDGVNYPLYYALQTISSFTGVAIILVFVFLMKPDPAAAIERPSFTYWIISVFIIAAMVILRFRFGQTILNFENFVVSFISAMCCAMLITGFIKFKRMAT